MKKSDTAAILGVALPMVLALVGAFFVGSWWGGSRRAVTFEARVPGADVAPGQKPPTGGSVNLAGEFVQSGVVPAAATLPGSWPRFRGARFDGIATGTPPLARKWGSDGPATLWSVDLGEGYAGAAVLNGRVYVLDYDQTAQRDALRCLSLEDGSEIWRRSYPVKIKRNHGMSRTVPAVTPKYVVSMGPKCHVLCLDAATGKYLWGIDLVRQYRTRVPPWYAGQCPLIDGDRAILAPGGTDLMIAVDCATGKVLWKTPNPRKWGMSHSSIVPMVLNGQRQYVYCAGGGVVGVDPKDGRILWDTPEWKISIAMVPSPIAIGADSIFVCGGYNSGAALLRLKREGGKTVPEIAYRLKPADFGSDQQTPILYQGKLYGVIPGGQLVCLNPADGKRLWSSGTKRRFGLGPYVLADGMLYLLNDSGALTLVEATPEGYKELSHAEVLKGHDAWGPLAIAGTRLLARDLTKMVCLEIGG